MDYVLNCYLSRMSMPLISVILPTYNGNKKWLSESIDSVLNQTYSDFELIVVNDASTNNIEQTILDYVKHDSRIVYLKNNQNIERSASKNKAIRAARGEYIAFIDDDDIRTDPMKLEKQIVFMQKDKQYGLVGAGKIIVINREGFFTKTIFNRTNNVDIKKHLLQSNQFVHSGVLVRKNVLLDAGLFDEKRNLAEDYDLWLRIGRISSLANLQSVEISYRDRLDNTSRKNVLKMKYQSLFLSLKYSYFYPKPVLSFFLRLAYLLLPDSFSSYIITILKK